MDITKPNIYDPYEHPEEWTPETYNALERARDIIEEWWLPNRRMLDRLGGVLAMTEMSEAFYGLYKAIIDGGFFGRDIPKEYGGPGWTLLQCALVSAEIVKMSFSPAVDNLFAYGEPAAQVLLGHTPDEDAKKEYLQRYLDGGYCTIFAMDPESGVDMGAMRGTAELRGDYYYLNGPKWWMSSSSPGPVGLNWHLALMKTDTTKRTSGLSLFIINDDAPGIIRGREGDLMGQRWACARYEILLKDVKVLKKYLAAPEGKGLYAIVDAMNKHMGNQALQAVGVSEAAINQALDYTTTTIRWDHPLIEYQGVNFPIADMWVNAEASRAIATKACKLWDERDEEAKYGKWSVLAFRMATSAAVDACRKTIELMGARAIEREEGWPMELMYRESMIFQLYRTPNVDRKFLASFLVRRRL
ncbi:MAG: acyl-CoA/acyl-ACP dehydrogenase [Dehalococcoidia bacterium]|nr:MAG: acyl-CoA/acyl-ACP dehydrogenase [Dehalococcoidia bacterium]